MTSACRRALELGASDVTGEPAAVVLTAHGGIESALAELDPGGTLLVFCVARATASLDAVYRSELHVVGSRSATPAHFDAARRRCCRRSSLPPVRCCRSSGSRTASSSTGRGAALKVVFTP